MSTEAVTMSPTINELATALAKAQAEIEGARKDSTNPHFRSQYADLASVWDACREPLTKHGLSVVQLPDRRDSEIGVTTLLMHTSGQWISGRISTVPGKLDPQAVGSCVTYLRRYSLAAAVGVAPEDDDGEGATKRDPVQDAREVFPDATEVAPRGRPGKLASQAQINFIFKQAEKAHIKPDVLKDWLGKETGMERWEDMPANKVNDLLKWIEGPHANP